MNYMKRTKAKMRVANQLGYYYPLEYKQFNAGGLHYVGRSGGNSRQGIFPCLKCDGYGFNLVDDGLKYEDVDCPHCKRTGYLGKLYTMHACRRYRVFKTKVARAACEIYAYRWLGHRDKSLAFSSGGRG